MNKKLLKINKNKMLKIQFKYYKTLILKIYQFLNFIFQIFYFQKKKIWIRKINYNKLYKISIKQKFNIKNNLHHHKIKLN